MKRRVRTLLAGAFFFICPFKAPAASHHSIAEYAYLVGTWSCTAHAKNRTIPYATKFSWLYPEHLDL